MVNEDNNDRLLLLQLDICDQISVEKSVSKVEKFLERKNLKYLHALINNAGVCIFAEFDWYTDEQYLKQINVNLIGTIRMCKNYLHLLRPRNFIDCSKLNKYDDKRIINVCSVNSLYAYPGISVYTATKFGIKGFSDSLRFELNKFNIKVINIYPGDYCRLTNLFKQHFIEIDKMDNEMDEDKKSFYKGYFEIYNKNVIENHGIIGAKSFEETNLFNHFLEALISKHPRSNIISGNLISTYFLRLLSILPINCSQFILDSIFKYIFNLDPKNLFLIKLNN